MRQTINIIFLHVATTTNSFNLIPTTLLICVTQISNKCSNAHYSIGTSATTIDGKCTYVQLLQNHREVGIKATTPATTLCGQTTTKEGDIFAKTPTCQLGKGICYSVSKPAVVSLLRLTTNSTNIRIYCDLIATLIAETITMEMYPP